MARTIIKASYINPDICFECGAPATERHHVIPHSLGGTKTVPLCGECHAKVHGVNGAKRAKISELTKAALDAKKARGEYWLRNSDTSKAVLASARNRTERSRTHPSNVFFMNYVKQFEERHGKLTPNRSKEVYELLASELNALDQTTVTGLPYNSNRCRAILTRMRRPIEFKL
jgi:hypothetical protein